MTILDNGQDVKDSFTSKTIETIQNLNKKVINHPSNINLLNQMTTHQSGQTIATSHNRFPSKGSVSEGKPPYFRETQVGEVL